MVTTHNLGFPRIGSKRELKFALEAYWEGGFSLNNLETIGKQLRQQNWQIQQDLDLIPMGDFSFYDHVLDMSFLLGNIPERVKNLDGEEIDHYFQVARGRSARNSSCNCSVLAGEMTKWFDTNYHYIVPEFTKNTKFELNIEHFSKQLDEAKEQKGSIKPVLIGPVTYLWLGKSYDHTDRLSLLPDILLAYKQLLQFLFQKGISWVQFDEPILVMELEKEWKEAFIFAYNALENDKINILLATYFGQLKDNLKVLQKLPVQGIHLDAINARDEVEAVINGLGKAQILSLGVVNGRNIWKADLNAILEWLEPIYTHLQERLWLAPSCSLLHVPVDVSRELKMDSEIRSWLSFAVQKLDEINILAKALKNGRKSVKEELKANEYFINQRQQSKRVNNPEIKNRYLQNRKAMTCRQSSYSERVKKQIAILNLPLFPTTTIGSFPQTPQIRQIRNKFRKGDISWDVYENQIKEEIEYCIKQQEALGLDVLVHGEPERNDMVEYFGELLEGYVISQQGWVQSYGSRCVKPPILYGDIHRPAPMTISWILYAQSLTKRPVKGMLTGPVTILNWSFVREDQPRSETCYQLATAIREEVLDLEKSGIRIIQIDEAALREGLPLRHSQWQHYLDWAIESFKITASGVSDETQIHTHMCYSEFNDIIASIAEMDADVITIETSRSNMELLKAFENFDYPNSIGPGVYDIHSPNIPKIDHIVQLIHKAAEHIPPQKLWVNPDCGLKTRRWEEVLPALKNMVEAAYILRKDNNLQ